MPETTLQNMSEKGNRLIKPRTKKNEYIPPVLVQLRLINKNQKNKDIYPLVPVGKYWKRGLMNTDEILQRWLDEGIPEAYIYE